MSQNFATWLGKSNLARKNDIAALVKKKKKQILVNIANKAKHTEAQKKLI